MNNIINIKYHQTGKSKNTNEYGMREMQARAFEKRNSQYLLIKSPPASGKSRALMFISLDKLENQGIKKVIVAVPERSIGASFKDTDLKSFGFFKNWKVKPENNLTIAGTDEKKVKKVINFLNSNDEILICTHSTFRFAYEKLENDQIFDSCVIAIDEFHHVSADGNSVLGEALRNIIRNSTAHIIAMTGSYFRGDSVPILEPMDEEKFDTVTYTYYEQLNGYEYLKSFSINYNFYTGQYFSALKDILDTDKKTIIHIPNVNSLESTKDKYNEVDRIIDIIGDIEYQDEKTGIYYIKRHKDGKIIKVADLVNDEKEREKVSEYLRNISNADDLDIIIALGMAKEGFDWTWCEHALTIGYRGSLTEIVQIIGRCTRDSSNKTHAQFTNLIAQPDAQSDEVTFTVNTFLKAISASLLMEQVLAPDVKFNPRRDENQKGNSQGQLFIKGLKEPSTDITKKIVEEDLAELKASILSDEDIQKAITTEEPRIINQLLIPKVIQKKYPNLTDEEIDEVRQHVITDIALKSATFETVESKGGNKEFIKMADKFIKVDELDINLIESVNPFQKAYSVISKELDVPTLKIIKKIIDEKKLDISEEEVLANAHLIKEFFQQNGRLPDTNSSDEVEQRLGYIFLKLNHLKRKKDNGNL